MAETPPYLLTPGSLASALNKIKAAATPDRFTVDLLANTLGMKGGNSRPIIPYLKRIGFLASDGSPTDLYKRFRNDSESGDAAAEALRAGYKTLFAINENAQDLPDKDLKGVIVQATGLQSDARVVQAIQGTFKALKKFASVKPSQVRPDTLVIQPSVGANSGEPRDSFQRQDQTGIGLNLSYTINLNLPASPDIAVFNAIFKSLKENLLKQ